MQYQKPEVNADIDLRFSTVCGLRHRYIKETFCLLLQGRSAWWDVCRLQVEARGHREVRRAIWETNRECDNEVRFRPSINLRNTLKWPIAVAAQPKGQVYGRSLAGTVGSNPAGGLDVCLLLSVVRGLCVALVTRPEEFYRVWCVNRVWSRSP